MRNAALERAKIPPDLRALARVVSDVDYIQFPELHPPDGLHPPVHELHEVLSEIKGAPLSNREFRDFQTVFMEVKHHLRGVDAATLAESQVGAALALTSRLDSICTEANVPLAFVFPHAKAAHNFFLDITSFKFSVKQSPVFYRLSDVICALLQNALVELQRYIDTLDLVTLSDNSLKTNNSNFTQRASKSIEDDMMQWRQEGVNLPVSFDCIFADIDGDIGVHLAHLRWYLEVCRQSIFFDAGAYIGDVSVRKLWTSYVGQDVPACFSENFTPALQLFPEWSRAPIMDVLDYKQCGVVSLYTLKRLLSVWGPFLLLDRNMKDDMRGCLYDLTHSLQYHQKTFALRPEAEEGDCLATLTEIPGEVVALILVRQTRKETNNNNNNNSNSNNNNNGLTTRIIRFTQNTGAWVGEGLTMKEYDTVYDACRAFSELFRRPCGKCYNMHEKYQGFEAWDDLSTAATHSASSLHRACFRNNERYVKTLLTRGSAIVLNTALVDPAISSKFSWTPLLCAVNNPNSDPGPVVQLLLNEKEPGVDVHLCDDAQCTALYYAIANGYVNATRVLLQHCPQLRTSSSSEALLIALGAHYFHARERDIRRLSDVIPSAEMMEVLLPYQTDIRLVRLAIDIITGKLWGEERVVLETDDPSIWHPDGEIELRTRENEIYLDNIIAYHSRLCRQYRSDVARAAKLLYSHCYFLSCREHFKQKSDDKEEDK